MQAYGGLSIPAGRAARVPTRGRTGWAFPFLLTLVSSLALAGGLGTLATSLLQRFAGADEPVSIAFVTVVALVTAGVGHWLDVRSGQRPTLAEDDQRGTGDAGD